MTLRKLLPCVLGEIVNKCSARKENVPLALEVMHEKRLLQLEVISQIEEMLPFF